MIRKKKPSGGKKLSTEKPARLIKLFQKKGWGIDRQTGSHVVMVHDENPMLLVIPVHSNEIQPELIQSLLKQAGISREEYFELL